MEAGVPWTHAVALLSRCEQHDFAARLAADHAARSAHRREQEAAQASEMAEMRRLHPEWFSQEGKA
jgi:hypothetical protein